MGKATIENVFCADIWISVLSHQGAKRLNIVGNNRKISVFGRFGLFKDIEYSKTSIWNKVEHITNKMNYFAAPLDNICGHTRGSNMHILTKNVTFFSIFYRFPTFFTLLFIKDPKKVMFSWKYGQSYYRKCILCRYLNFGTFSTGGQTPKFCWKYFKNISFWQFWAFEIYQTPEN